jgi:tRNA nucleotidyltransferase/poly(A) polymerase
MHEYELTEISKNIIRALKEEGFQGYIVGGFNRDRVLLKDPHDVDIVTDAIPDAILEIFSDHVCIEVGKAFGTIVVAIGDANIEITTMRRESGYSDGRHPDKVEYSNSIEEDYKRRDFTCNAIYRDPLKFDSIQNLIDPAGGIEDLRNNILKTVGKPIDRFTEDPLRMMRALRIASSNTMDIDLDLYNAIRQLSVLLKNVSKERIISEMDKMFKGNGEQIERFLFMMCDTGIMEQLFPDIMEMEGYQQPLKWHFIESEWDEEAGIWDNNVLRHTLFAIKSLGHDHNATPLWLAKKAGVDSVDLVWSILLHDIAKPHCYKLLDGNRHTFHGHEKSGEIVTKELLKEWKFSNERIDRISDAVGNHRHPQNSMEMKNSTLKKFMNKDSYELIMSLSWCDCSASCGDLSGWNYIRHMEKVFEKKNEKKLPQRLMTGKDLIELGLKPGPEFKNILDWAYEYQLENSDAEKEMVLRSTKYEWSL